VDRAQPDGLEYGDAIGKVSIDKADRGAGLFCDHRGGQTLVPVRIDRGRCGVEQCCQPRGAPGLNGFVTEESVCYEHGIFQSGDLASHTLLRCWSSGWRNLKKA